MDDLSDVIALLNTGTYTVTRRPVTTYVEGRVYDVSGITTAWVALTVYAQGAQRRNGAGAYQCITAGTSAASGGPTGTGSDITDGTAHWEFLGSAISTFTCVACVQPLSGRELKRLPEGMREREAMAFWTSSELRGKLSTNDPDSIVIDGDVYEVTTVDRWANLGNYYRAVVVKTVTRS